jgi:hypothetical protein
VCCSTGAGTNLVAFLFLFSTRYFLLQVLWSFALLLDIITMFTLVLLRHLGGVIYVWFFSLLYVGTVSSMV